MVNSHQQQQNISNSLEKRRISRAIFYIKRVIDDFEKFVAFSIATTNVKEVNHSYENKNKEFIADARIKAKEILDTYNHQFNAFIAQKSIDAAITDSLIRECFLLWDTINKQSNSANYYASNCIEENWGDPTYCRQLFEQITEYHRRIFAGLNANRKKYENTLNSLFNYYCNTSDLSDDDCLLYRQMVINSNDSDMQIGNLVQPLLVSALTLNNLTQLLEIFISDTVFVNYQNNTCQRTCLNLHIGTFYTLCQQLHILFGVEFQIIKCQC